MTQPETDSTPEPAPSIRPEVTAEIQARTGLDEPTLTTLVHRFYDRIQQDPMLGPIFATKITDWPPHLDRMVAFWSSVALMTGRYHGAPVPKHMHLPVDDSHFDHWLSLFEDTARKVCTPEGAAHVIERAHRIARSLRIAVRDANQTGVPNLG
ncbi:group III truncated hemoglobin [Pseudooceanicola nitratireducens]|uniref:group III truncated hemoglobin n=1 Tax=Pseudooceanicola nitratireducens TaxID=517719 RepID=UPI0023F424CD|nr:group III truncated hemoglobin [Pseudooceanicola nitratireducens]